MWSVHTKVDDARRDRRVEMISLEIELEKQFYTTVDWSLGGFLIEGYEGRRRPVDVVTVGITVKVGEETYEHAASAAVVRFVPDKNQLFAARFLRLDAATVNTLEGHMTGRLRRRKPGTAKSRAKKRR